VLQAHILFVMRKVVPSILFLILLTASRGHGRICRTGWTLYKSEICFKLFPKPMTYSEAEAFCTSQSESIYNPSLLQLDSLQLQSFLDHFTTNNIEIMHNNIWIGTKLNQADRLQLQSENSCECAYSNDKCLQIESRNNKVQQVDCDQVNLPLCQRTMDWTAEDFIRKITNHQNSIVDISTNLIPIKDGIKKVEANGCSIATLNSSLISIKDDIKKIDLNSDSIAAHSSRLILIENAIKEISVNHDNIVALTTRLIQMEDFIKKSLSITIELWFNAPVSFRSDSFTFSTKVKVVRMICGLK